MRKPDVTLQDQLQVVREHLADRELTPELLAEALDRARVARGLPSNLAEARRLAVPLAEVLREIGAFDRVLEVLCTAEVARRMVARRMAPRARGVLCSQTTPCCDRAGEHNGYGTDRPTTFACPRSCPCHD